MTIDKILEYVMSTPYNTNYAILKTMLEALVDSENEDDLVAESITIEENGTYTAPEGKAYSEVIVNVSTTIVEEPQVEPQTEP